MKKTILSTLLFLLVAAQAHATKYWISTSGSDANACSAVDGDADPGVYRRNVATTWTDCLVAGDTLYMKAGTYTEFVYNGNFSGYPAGTSWSAPITIASAPSETAVWRPTSSGAVNLAYTSYIIFDRITFDGNSAAAD